MPSDHTNCDEKYKDSLAQLEEIINKFESQYQVILCGDFNASIHRDNRSRDKSLKQFMESNEIKLVNGYPKRNTFYHHNQMYTSQIDYIMHKSVETNLEYKVDIFNMEPLNVSDHTLVIARIMGTLTRKKRDNNTIVKRPDWRKCDKQLFQKTIIENLQKFNYETVENPTIAVNKLEQLFHDAGTASIPNYRKTVTVKPKGNAIWNKEISCASEKSKATFHKWKQDKDNIELKAEMVCTKRQLRSAQRRAEASLRTERTNKIMQSMQSDNKLFHQLVKNQRCKKSNVDLMIFQNQELEETELILNGWKQYFSELYSTNNSDTFNEEKLHLAKIQNKIIESTENGKTPIEKTTVEEVSAVIKKLKTGKSPDINGISTEHFRYSPDEIILFLVGIINCIFKDLDVPESSKYGSVTPVLKPNKDKRYPENYRGISVTNIFSTIIEGILKQRIEPKLLPSQNKLQRGFTERTSSLNTAFIVTQTANYYKDKSQELFLITLDAQKAFDKVNHELLFNKLYHDGIDGDMWILLRNMYRGLNLKVKWNNCLTENVEVKQGIRQGAKLSTVLYKRYNNNILDALERSDMGAQIGNIRVVAPTCADDIALLVTSKNEAQALLDIVSEITNSDMVKINPTKSELVPLTKHEHEFSLNMNNEQIHQSSEAKHLGLIRNSKNSIDVEDRLKLARRTVYALMGPGLHAQRGMSPLVSSRLWKTYVIPRALYGIEVMNHLNSDIKQLEKLQLKICRQIQGLPDRTANLATYSLIGMEPIEAVVDRLILTFFGNIIQDKTSVEFKIIERQICMEKPNSKSYAFLVHSLLMKYKLPELLNLLKNPIEKQKWKKTVKEHMEKFWEDAWKSEKSTKSSLKFLNLHEPLIGKPHQVWKTVPNNCNEVKKAEVKVRLLTGTYMLQTIKSKFSKQPETELCKLCHTNEEDIYHFVLICPKLNDIRDKLLTTLKSYMNNIKSKVYDDIKQQGMLLQLILDSSMESIIKIIKLTKRHQKDIEQMTRTLCYSLHVKRAKLLNDK